MVSTTLYIPPIIRWAKPHTARYTKRSAAMPFLIRLLVNAAALWVATRLVPGVTFSGGPAPFFAVALVFGVINATLRPLAKVLTFPIILVTLGVFALVVN